MPWEKWLDTALYPDEEPPADMDSLPARVDFLARLCAAWDFGILPDPETVAEIRQPHWRGGGGGCRPLTPPAPHPLPPRPGRPPPPPRAGGGTPPAPRAGGGGCLPPAALPGLSPSARLARPAASPLPGATTGLHPG